MQKGATFRAALTTVRQVKAPDCPGRTQNQDGQPHVVARVQPAACTRALMWTATSTEAGQICFPSSSRGMPFYPRP